VLASSWIWQQPDCQVLPTGIELASMDGLRIVRPAYLDGGHAAAMGPSALEQFLAHVQADPALRRQVSEAITADEVSLLAQTLGYPVSGSDLLRFSGRSAAGVRVTRIDHPGEYPGRYV